jgi:hypothetical protein
MENKERLLVAKMPAAKWWGNENGRGNYIEAALCALRDRVIAMIL